MKISTKGRYALKLMLDLAVNNTGEYITIKSISQRQELSDKYLEQIITQLSRAGFVKSTRGAQGGYRLARNPEEYTVGSILRLFEGTLAPVACVEDEQGACDKTGQCALLDVWVQLHEAINNVVDNITLADLVHKQNSLSGNDYMI